MSDDEKMLKPALKDTSGLASNVSNQSESKKDGFELNPKYKSVEEQARAYGEAQKTITKKSQEVAELKKQLDEAKILFQNLANTDYSKHQKPMADGANAVFENPQDDNQEQNLKLEFAQGDNEFYNPHNEADNIQNVPRKAYDNNLAVLKRNHKAQVNNINKLFKSGQITLAQALKLKEHLDQKMNDSTKKVHHLANSVQNEIQELRKNKAIDGFKAQKPDFFNSDVRLEVIDYLKSASDDLTNQELENVAKLVEKVEQSAIEKFKVSQAQGDFLEKMNEQAKVRLNSSIEGAGSSAGAQRVFTTDEIKKMSNKEFRKHEKQIMDQMKKGKIKG